MSAAAAAVVVGWSTRHTCCTLLGMHAVFSLSVHMFPLRDTLNILRNYFMFFLSQSVDLWETCFHVVVVVVVVVAAAVVYHLFGPLLSSSRCLSICLSPPFTHPIYAFCCSLPLFEVFFFILFYMGVSCTTHWQSKFNPLSCYPVITNELKVALQDKSIYTLTGRNTRTTKSIPVFALFLD
jgi:hypothetical protein